MIFIFPICQNTDHESHSSILSKGFSSFYKSTQDDIAQVEGVGKNGGGGGGGGKNNDSSGVSQHNAGRNIELGKKVHTWKHWYIHLKRLKKKSERRSHIEKKVEK